MVKLQPIDPVATQGRTVGFGEAVGAGFESARLMGSTAENVRRSEVYGGWAPILDRVAQGYVDLPADLHQSLTEQGYSPDEETLGRLSEWAVEGSKRYGFEITEDMQPEEVSKRRELVFSQAAQAVETEQEVLQRASPFSRNVGGLVGGVGAEFLDPLNLATLPAGAPARAGLLGTVLIEAGLNAFLEAADTPNRNAIARRLDQEESGVLENAALGAIFGGAFAGVIKGAEVGVRGLSRIGRLIPDRKPLIAAAEASGDPEAATLAQALRRDVEDEEAATSGEDMAEVREHIDRSQAGAEALHGGGLPPVNDRPAVARPRSSILNGEIEEVNPKELLVQPDVFQFKSDIVAEGGVTEKLVGVQEWAPERAGIVLVYEYADGSRAVADGHQRTALANRIMAGGGDEIRLAAKVFREEDGFTPEDIRVLAALKNISEAADGMTAAMARDAARVLRVKPEAISDLPKGPGIARAQSLAKLSDEAFDMFINEVVPERFAELVGRMVENPDMHGAMMSLLRKTRPDTTAQAESILAQAMQAPVNREVTADLFGEQEIVESLYLERAKVLERAMKIMRDDRTVFKTLDESAERIQGTGSNRLDTTTNKQTRQQVEQAMVAVQRLAHRAGGISEALNDGAKSYKETGRLKDAAQTVVDAIRTEIERNGLSGAGAGATGRNAEPTAPSAETLNPVLSGFDDPINGEGAKAQIEATRDQLQRPSSEAMTPEEMEARAGSGQEYEVTEAGQQGLFDGVEPITQRDRLELEAARPMGGQPRGDDSQIGGLFDDKDPGRFDLFDAVPVGRGFDEDGNEIAVVKSRADLAAELDADDEAVEILDICVRG